MVWPEHSSGKANNIYTEDITSMASEAHLPPAIDALAAATAALVT